MTVARRGASAPVSGVGAPAIKPLRIYLVDDSATIRAAFRRLFAMGDDVQVVGEAPGGAEALAGIPAVRPDVVLMDVMMPRIDGLETTARLMATNPVPIVIVSELVGSDASLNFRALEAGAVDLLRKPSVRDIGDGRYRDRLVRTLRALASIPVVTRSLRPVVPVAAPPAAPLPVARADSEPRDGTQYGWLAVGASTGGPPALVELFGALRPFDGPAVVVQHMMPGFTAGLVEWLADRTRRPVALAVEGEIPRPGVTYLAPEGADCTIREGRFRRSECAPGSLFCPSVDALFRSLVADGLATQTIGLLLTGMGSDGATGLKLLRDAGAHTIAQDEATSVVWGMPKAAVERGAAAAVLPLPEIAPRLGRLLRKGAT